MFKKKKNELEKVRFIKENELKLTHVELYLFFHFKCVAANVSELFCMANLFNNERFLYHSNLSLKIPNFLCMPINSPA